MNITQIETNLQNLIEAFSAESFIYDFLLAYGTPNATIARLKTGNLNLSKTAGEIAWVKKMCFKTVTREEDLPAMFKILKTHPAANKHKPRFIILTDFETFLAFDTKTGDDLDIPILEIHKNFDFFLPLAGMEKAQVQSENPADVRAAEKMAKLYDRIKADNPTENAEEVHNLNVFLSRLLFCFFAEDTGIFPKDIFTEAIGSHTQADGSDLHAYLDRLFEVMNTPENERENGPVYLRDFPYVNGGLFRNKHKSPIFTQKSRKTVIECGELQWSAINPDIFGSMIQAVITPEHRGGLGMHYTSVPNIMKVIEPLFLNDLYEEYDAAKGNPKRITQLLTRIANIKIFDPACGSGNFLIIAYKELRTLEMRIFEETRTMAFSGVKLSNFFGIELDDFAHEIAILSLWLAEHQMNQAFFKAFNRAKPALPLMETGNIVHGNATRIDWDSVCPKMEGDEIYVLGNPPYLGSRNQDEIQKADMKATFKIEYKSLDYVACWLMKASKFIDNFNSQFAFVTTNSICQGEQVALLWPKILRSNLEIGFAQTGFKWSNNAKDKAAVIVIIVGIRNISAKEKRIYSEKTGTYTKPVQISPYLTEGNVVYIKRRSTPLSNIPECTFGSMPNDGGNLILSTIEKNYFIQEYPDHNYLIKKFIGAQDLINGGERWCFVIDDENLEEANKIDFIAKRLLAIKALRKNSTESSTRKMAEMPHKFYFFAHKDSDSIIIPSTTSERREYIPIGRLDSRTVVSNSAQVIYAYETHIFGVLTSKIHNIWIRAVAGRLKSDCRYSSSLVYNNFPVPNLSDPQKKELESHVYRILEERENHSEKTLAQLYDPEKMPDGLREAHRANDLAVERCYRSKSFDSDEERLAYLFKLYEQMIADEKARNGEINFDAPKPKKRTKK